MTLRTTYEYNKSKRAGLYIFVVLNSWQFLTNALFIGLSLFDI